MERNVHLQAAIYPISSRPFSAPSALWRCQSAPLAIERPELVMSILVNETGRVHETVNDNRLEKAWLQSAILHEVWMLARFMAPFWLVPANMLWCNARHGWGTGLIRGHSQSAIWMQRVCWGRRGRQLRHVDMSRKCHLAPGPPDCACPILFTSINTDYIPKFYMSKVMWNESIPNYY